ncbi:MAG: hypothetical protein JWP64_1742 [Pseudonocardia sp.]|nr:hypothetical protein [Pseudonocardia sp.]
MPDDLMPDDRDARLAELHRLRLGDILYPRELRVRRRAR